MTLVVVMPWRNPEQQATVDERIQVYVMRPPSPRDPGAPTQNEDMLARHIRRRTNEAKCGGAR
jgi:hypothetical protein